MHTHWQQELRHAIRNPFQLLALLKLPLTVDIDTAKQPFNLRVPLSYVKRMCPGDVHDPLLRQVLPLRVENQAVSGFTKDPVGDTQATKMPGLLHKYAGRVLLLTTKNCAIHCRYCFRRHYVYGHVNLDNPQWLEPIRSDTSITEVILSGGDPLMLSDQRLVTLIHALAQIPQVQRLRLHSRLPIVLPERMTDELLRGLTSTRLQPVLVIHANHANEFNDAVQSALQRLQRAGIVLLNQAVLLRGVNDNVSALVALSERLISHHVLPYYLHILDRVQGAAHFAVDRETARQLQAQLQLTLPGYLVPKIVEEVAGLAYKRPLEARPSS